MQENAVTYTAPLPTITITDDAAKKLHEIFLNENNPDLKLRIFIEGGGCSGFKYEFAFETEIEADDQIFCKDMQDYKVEVVVDPMSFLLLQNAEIDYEKSFQDEKFIVRNPNATTTCGCGSSFSA